MPVGGRDGGSKTQKGNNLQGAASSGRFGGDTGGHIEESSEVQTRITRGRQEVEGRSKSKFDLERIDADNLGMEYVYRCTIKIVPLCRLEDKCW